MMILLRGKPWFGTVLRWGFKGKKQIPLFLVWSEDWEHGEVVFARVLFRL